MVKRDFPNTHSAPLDALEFELTDLSAARHALDEVPAGIGRAETFAPGYWERRRRPTQPTDRALAGLTVEWTLGLPPELRPAELGRQFPRLANALAAAWPDRGRALALLDSLLIDRRGGRRGLPREVQVELTRLQELLARSPTPVPSSGPSAAPQSTVTPDMLERARRLLESAGYRVIAPGG